MEKSLIASDSQDNPLLTTVKSIHSEPRSIRRSRFATAGWPTTCFETFPFPRPTQAQNETISKAATYLEQCRTHLKGKSKTLTEIYNALEECRKNPSPTHEAFTLMDAHERLDKAVFAAYGWEHPLSDDEILERLLALNLERAAAQGETVPVVTEAD